MLVDTGVGWDQAHDHDGYYGGILARLLTDRDEYILPVEQELEVQVERLGYELGDIETVFMTHVHDDHAGGLRSVPNAKVFLGKADWERGVLYGPSFETDTPRFCCGWTATMCCSSATMPTRCGILPSRRLGR
jgi:glyoxylase-like metal-dependent hydrolase (beta-lactamase superfamily II)